MRKFPIAVAVLIAFATAGPALAAEVERVVTPDIFTAPPAFPAPRVYNPPAGYEPAVVPGAFTAPVAFPAVRLYNWTGAYVGINGGGAWGRPDWTSVPDLSSGTYNLSGGLVGGTVGYNLQTGEPFVWGVEADLAWSGVRGTVPPLSCIPSCEMRSDWLGTARLRVGYAFDTVMPYVTAGAAEQDRAAVDPGKSRRQPSSARACGRRDGHGGCALKRPARMRFRARRAL